MATYDVHVGGPGRVRTFRAHIEAASPAEALMAARRSVPAPAWHGQVSVYRHRRLRGRRLVGTYLAGDPGDDGLAGVREPRRPAPGPPGLRAEAEDPAYRHH